MSRRVLVCGGRDYADHRHVNDVLDALVATERDDRLAIIEGCARGADELAECWARVRRQENLHFPADWQRDGKAAGPIRNRRMLVEGKPDLVVAFPGGRGTANMVEQAHRAGIPVHGCHRPARDVGRSPRGGVGMSPHWNDDFAPRVTKALFGSGQRDVIDYVRGPHHALCEAEMSLLRLDLQVLLEAANLVDAGWHDLHEGGNVRLRYASDLPARLNTLRIALREASHTIVSESSTQMACPDDCRCLCHDWPDHG